MRLSHYNSTLLKSKKRVFKFFAGLHGDKTYNTFCLWKHHVNLLLPKAFDHIISTDEDPGLRIESFAVMINLRGVSTNKKYYKIVKECFQFDSSKLFRYTLVSFCDNISVGVNVRFIYSALFTKQGKCI
jgi:hypothetical protein